MELLPLDQLIVPEGRQRREFDAKRLEELCTSILSKGLLHPLVVRNDGRTLVAGERRLRAIQTLRGDGLTFKCAGTDVEQGKVPCVRIADLDELAVREAELEENIIRVDLTWQERARAVAALHELRLEQNPLQTRQETETEVLGAKPKGGAHVVSNALLVSRHLNDPEVSKQETQKDALRVVRRKLEREFHEKLVEQGISTPSAGHAIFQGEAQTHLPTLPPESFDCILTDPPYGVDVEEIDESQVSVPHEYDDDSLTWTALMQTLADESYRVAKPRAHLYIFCSLQRFDELKRIVTYAGWRVFRTPLIWFKPNSGLVPWAGHGPRCNTEGILYANKGWRPTLKAGSDLIECPQEHDNLHAAKKPLRLYMELLERSCYPGDVVLDPFCGSGTIFQAANELKLTATGIEKVKAHFNLSLSRMSPGA